MRYAGVFAAVFAAYLYTMPGTIAAYRDAGEMTTAAHTLGVAHPPGYPLYVLAGRLSDAVPLANPAYRLNLLSAACGAGAAAAAAWAAAPIAGIWGLGAAALLAADRVFWQASGVSEMYTLGILLAAVCLGLALRLRRRWDDRVACLAGLLFGLTLAARMDLLLLAPAFALLPFRSPSDAWSRKRSLARAGAFFALGFAIYLYLPARAFGNPVLDWNDPRTFERFFNGITRRSYGGTLDLLSREYAAGANFGANMALWAEHLLRTFSLALPAAAAGLVSAALGAGPWVGLALTGPVFLYMANMPPNPHAVAIVEPHWLASDLLLAVLAAAGAAALARRIGRAAVAAALVAAVAASAMWARPDRRWSLAAWDASAAQLRSLPPDSSLVAKKDVQLFSLWHQREVAGRRRDAVVVAQGLSGSDWYRRAMAQAHPGLRLSRFTEEGWAAFVAERGPVYATVDAEYPAAVPATSWGPVVRLGPGAPSAGRIELLTVRGPRAYDEQPDFFGQDLAADQASAWHRAGSEADAAGRPDEAFRDYARSWSFKRLTPEAPLFMGLVRFRQGRIEEAESRFATSSRLFDEALDLAARYRSLPNVLDGLKRGSANALVNQGAAAERLGRSEQAEALYVRALERDPSMAQAHYNLAVLKWGKDWAGARRELLETLRLDPRHAEAARFLQRLPH